MNKSSGRRRFLQSVTAMGAVGLPTTAFPDGTDHKHAVQHAPATSAGAAHAYMYFSTPEAAFVEAAVARLIPADELGPGAKEAGVAYFIDQQLLGAYGTMAKNYRQGPWGEGTPQQGYQSPLTPQEVYRAAIADVDRHCSRQYGKSFDALAPTVQDEVLRGLEESKIALDTVPARFFFNMLLANTIEGFFADPVYGGNRDKIGWRLVGFPGVAAAYTNYIDQHGAPYRAEPVSIVDIRQQVAELDEHGHPRHALSGKSD